MDSFGDAVIGITVDQPSRDYPGGRGYKVYTMVEGRPLEQFSKYAEDAVEAVGALRTLEQFLSDHNFNVSVSEGRVTQSLLKMVE